MKSHCSAPEYFGKRLGELMNVLPSEVQIVALRRNEQNQPASPDSVIAENDVLLIVGPTKEQLANISKSLGEAVPGRIAEDRRHLDYLRVFASRPTVVGRTLGELNTPGDKARVVIHVSRGDTDVQARPDLVLEFGDRVGLLANRGTSRRFGSFLATQSKGPPSSATSQLD